MNIQAEMEKRLRNFAVGDGHPLAPETETIPTPLGLNVGRAVDHIQTKIDAFLSTKPRLEKIIPKYGDIPEVTDKFVKITTDFPDGKLLSNPAIIFEHLTDQEIVEIGRETIPMMASGFSQRGAGAIFLLAYHLIDPSDGEYVLDMDDDMTLISDVPLGELNTAELTTKRTHEPLIEVTEDWIEAQAYAYLAASTLRLFTKSDDNYTRAFNHILIGYQRFYGSQFPLNPPQPTVEALRTLTHFFTNELMKSSLYRILYTGGGTKKAEGLRKFLYEIHLANTGMHIVSIFVRLCSVLNCTPGLLLTAISSKEYERQLDALVTMIKLITLEDDNHKRMMWRYGRLFDEGFMSPLQTKVCPSLTFILASALKGESAKTNQDILNIAQLADVSPEKRRIFAAVGEMVVRMIREHNAGEDTSPALSLLYL